MVRFSSRKRDVRIISASSNDSDAESLSSFPNGNDSDGSWAATPTPRKKKAKTINKKRKVGATGESANNPGPSWAPTSTEVSLTIPTFPAFGASAQNRKRESGGKLMVIKPKFAKVSKTEDKKEKFKKSAQPKPKYEVGAKKGGSAKGVGLSEALECIICQEFPVSPIHNCTNGHITCGTCVDKLAEKKCGLCKAKLQRSILGERLAKQYEVKLKCDNSEEGCKAMINSTEMKAHLKTCNFRDINCYQEEGEPCAGQRVGIREFVAHFSAKHGIFPRIETGKLAICVLITKHLPKENISRGISTGLISIQRKGKIFIAHGHRTKDFFFFWVTLLGDKTDADKFLYELKLSPDPNSQGKNKKLAIYSKLPIIPYHEYPEFKRVAGNLSMIPIPSLIDCGFGQEFEVEGENQNNMMSVSFTLDIVSRS